MSSLMVDLWLMRLPDQEQIRQIDTLVSQIGVGKDIWYSPRLWRNYPFGEPREPRRDLRPIDRILQLKLSSRLRSMLLELDQQDQMPDDEIASVGWTFEFTNSTPLSDAPSAEKYVARFEGEEHYPIFGISIQNEPFRLLTGWGTSEYSSKKSVEEHAAEFEKIVALLDRFPVAQGMLLSKFPYDCLLAGYLGIQLLEILDAYLVLSVRDISTPLELAKIHDQVRQGTYPGRMYQIITEFETASGLRRHVKYLVDATFLREWMKHPAYTL